MWNYTINKDILLIVLSNYGNCLLHYSSISPWAENLLRQNCQFAPNAVGLQIWCLLLWVFLWFFFLGRGWFIYLGLILFCLLLYSHVAWGLVADPRVSIFKGPFSPLLLMSCLLKIKKLFRYLSNRTTISHLHGLPWWLNIKKKNLLAKAGDTGDLCSIPRARKIPMEVAMATHSGTLA